jgi:hypothetical protein
MHGGAKLNLSARVFTITHGSAWAVDVKTPLSSWTHNLRAGVKFVGCNQPALPLLFNDLPGQPGNSGYVDGPYEGMEYDISDAQKAGPAPLTSSDLGITVIGGGSQHAKVRYNGTNWTCMGL